MYGPRKKNAWSLLAHTADRIITGLPKSQETQTSHDRQKNRCIFTSYGGSKMIKSELPFYRTYFSNTIFTTNLSLTSSEIIAYITAILGMVGDQTSTRLGLMLPNVYESNPLVALLLSRGLWFPFDLLVLSISIVLPLFLMRVTSFEGKSAILAFPLIFGVIRIFASVLNFLLFFSY